MKKRYPSLLSLGVTAVTAAVVTVLARNFISGEKKIKHQVSRTGDIDEPLFERSMSQLLGPPILDGNLVTRLRNGTQIFPAMLAAIESATRSITFETYVYKTGSIADKFAAALAAKARSGVKVHVLMDGMGCNCTQGHALRQIKIRGSGNRDFSFLEFFPFQSSHASQTPCY